MRHGLALFAISAVVVLAVTANPSPQLPSRTAVPLAETGVPIAELAKGKPFAGIGLLAPLPTWLPLPKKGRAISGGVYPPQPPFGAASVIVLAIDEPIDEFLGSYARILESAGFTLSRLPNPAIPTDMAEARYEATNATRSRYVFVTLRQSWFVQLTFWDAPVPRMWSH
jgi:hypothetical protein